MLIMASGGGWHAENLQIVLLFLSVVSDDIKHKSFGWCMQRILCRRNLNVEAVRGTSWDGVVGYGDGAWFREPCRVWVVRNTLEFIKDIGNDIIFDINI
jgi:hypothetical protein